MSQPTPEQTATAQKFVTALNEMAVPNGDPHPQWMESYQSVLDEVARRVRAEGPLPKEEYQPFLAQFMKSQRYLSDDVKNMKSKWSDQSTETVVQSMKADIMSAFPGVRGGRRTRRTRKHRSRSRKYRSRR